MTTKELLELKELNGILCGTNKIIHDNLGNHNHGIFGKSLHKAPDDYSSKKLLQELVEKIEDNLRKARLSGVPSGKSKLNWRETSPTQVHDKRKLEREFEHHLVCAGAKNEVWTWWNQMPIASGLVKHRADRTRAIDLVCKNSANPLHYRLIELKINRNAGAPLSALIEILRYGLVYYVLRKNRKEIWLNDIQLNQEIFKATLIELYVIAPKNYYKGYNLGWLESSLLNALNEMAKNENLTFNLSSVWPVGLDKISKDTIIFEIGPVKMKSYLTNWINAY